MKVSPSLLAANFARLGSEIEMLNGSAADMVHLDVMDGVFVPNISFGFPVLNAVGKLSEKPLEPQKYISQVRDCGAAIMNVHQEACVHLDRTVRAIKEAGMKAAVTLNPSTPVGMLEDVIVELDMVLLMSVNPGFGGQKFIENTINKVKRLREYIAVTGSSAEIEIDGGVNMSTGLQLAEAGADILVAGSYVFADPDPAEAIMRLKSLV